MPRNKIPTWNNINKAHFLKFTTEIGVVIHFGPFPSNQIVKRYYDEYGSWLKERGDLDSVAINHSQIKNLGVLFSPHFWGLKARQISGGTVPDRSPYPQAHEFARGVREVGRTSG